MLRKVVKYTVMKLQSTLFFTYFFYIFSVYSSDYYNIDQLFGERASGMGGAFAAISDDASGSFYNPAGMSYSSSDTISVNASSYKAVKVTYGNIFGPSQDYIATSRNYLPNFIGVLKTFGPVKTSFSILNTVSETFHQSNQIRFPLYDRKISNVNVNLTEETYQMLVGPGASIRLFDNLSIGASVFHIGSSKRSIFSVMQEFSDKSVLSTNSIERNRTTGVMPVFGLQYMPLDKFSLGLSVRKKFFSPTIASSREYYVSSHNLSPVPEREVYSVYIDGNSKYQTAVFGLGEKLVISSPLPRNMPQVYEIRLGAAWFVSQSLLFSTDLIHTSGYRKRIKYHEYNITEKDIIYNDSDINLLRRNVTNNIALGLEYFVWESIVLRCGYFTNQSNNDTLGWKKATAIMLVEDHIGKIIRVKDNLYYANPRTRDEYVNMDGGTIGIGFVTAKSSISFSYSHLEGKGIAIIEVGKLPQIQKVINQSLYFVATTSY
jgi:hypothetical protein